MKKPNWKEWMKDKRACKKWLETYIKKDILKKSKDDSMLHLDRSDHNLKFANWIYEKHEEEIPGFFGDERFYDWVITIYYYAIYHSALALVSKEGYKSKNHSATICFLIYHHYHIQQSINHEDVELIVESLTKEEIESVSLSKELREKACYNVHETFEKTLADDAKEKAVNFINKIKIMLE
jgi:uncharacterized protein (UPF0332 family)